jgi:transaldolase
MQELLTATQSHTQVLLASIPDVPAMVRLARHGVSCFTMTPSVAEEFFTDALTAQAEITFEDAVRDTST